MRMVRAQFQDRHPELGERAGSAMLQDLAECMEAEDDNVLAQGRVEIIVDLIQDRGGLNEATAKDAVRTPAKVQSRDDVASMAAAQMAQTPQNSI